MKKIMDGTIFFLVVCGIVLSIIGGAEIVYFRNPTVLHFRILLVSAIMIAMSKVVLNIADRVYPNRAEN